MKRRQKRMETVWGMVYEEQLENALQDGVSEIKHDLDLVKSIRMLLKATDPIFREDRRLQLRIIKYMRKKYEPLWRLIDG